MSRKDILIASLGALLLSAMVAFIWMMPSPPDTRNNPKYQHCFQGDAVFWAQPEATFPVDGTTCTLYQVRRGNPDPVCISFSSEWGRFVRCKDGSGAYLEQPHGKFGWH